MTNEEIFNSKMESTFGPRLDVGRITPQAQVIFNRAAGRAKSMIESARDNHPGLPPIHFDWADSGELNACAFREQDKYFIGVTSGALYFARLLCNRMLADSRFLLHVGDPTAEEVLEPLPTWTTDARELLSAGAKIVGPKNPARQHYALHLEQQFMDFLVAHEITHIANGHVALVEAKFGQSILPENSWIQGEDQPPISGQTMEMDADSGAASAQIGTIRTKITDPNYRPAPPWDQYYRDPQSAIFNWSIGVSMFFRLFGDESFEDESTLTQHYPPIRIRQMMVANTATTYIVERWDKDIAHVGSKAIVDGQLEIEKAFPLMTGTLFSIEGWRQSYESYMRHCQKLLDYWKDVLRSELLPHAYGNLPD